MAALHEQYRPASWTDVVGQPKALARIDALRRCSLSGRAFWIAGQSGTGKTTIGRLIAREVSDPMNVEEFFAGDLGQRIFQTPFSWKSLGVDIRGRSQTLRINYRTSHQIRRQADRLLGPEMADVDGNKESRQGTVSVFNGPEPSIEVAESRKHEATLIGTWLADRIKDGVLPHEMGVFVRSEAELPRALAAIAEAGLTGAELDANTDANVGSVAIGTMHLAKGLEFRAVVVAACDDEILPSQARIESVTDDADLVEVYNTERHLLYVACTRARDHLLVIGIDPVSEFLDDLR